MGMLVVGAASSQVPGVAALVLFAAGHRGIDGPGLRRLWLCALARGRGPACRLRSSLYSRWAA